MIVAVIFQKGLCRCRAHRIHFLSTWHFLRTIQKHILAY